MPEVRIDVAPELTMFVAPRDRDAPLTVTHDGTSSLGHVVESAGVPLPEVGGLLVAGRAVPPSYRPADRDRVRVLPVPRPQPVPRRADGEPLRFVLDVHLGTLARRLRLVGVDAAYRNDAADPALVAQANAEHRVLLTQDRGLLRRRRLWLGAYVRGARPDAQLLDVLDRFAPRLDPWTRCTACNGTLVAVAKDAVAPMLRPGTRRTYESFARCRSCGRPYWRGAHHGRLAAIVDVAARTVAAAGSAGPAGPAGETGRHRRRTGPG